MLLQGKRALVFGVANDKSIAYGIAEAFKKNGARLAFSYVNEAIQKRVEPISETLGGEFIFPCDVTDDASIAASAEMVREKWGGVDVLVHSVAFANRDDLKGRYIETSRDGFKLALDISAFSLVALCRAYEDLLSPDASILTMTYHGSTKVVTNYNVMGVAKASLEANVRYMAYSLGPENIRVNAISAGPIRTLAASGIANFRRLLDYAEKTAPLRRNVSIEDVGNVAAFMCSDLAAGITGEVTYVDAGYNIVGGAPFEGQE